MIDKNKQKIYKNIIIGLIIFGFLAIIVSIFYINNKSDKNKDYIYENNDIPIINVDDNTFDNINSEIKELYNQASDTVNLTNQIYKNNDIYSLVIKKDSYSNLEEYYLTDYIIYNVDINSNKLLTNEELLQKYGYTKENVISSARILLNKYYLDEVNQGYVEGNECDLECYISSIRFIEDIYSNISLFVEDNVLKGYIEFYTNSYLSDQEYFENNENIHEFNVSKN